MVSASRSREARAQDVEMLARDEARFQQERLLVNEIEELRRQIDSARDGYAPVDLRRFARRSTNG
jgi:type VI secretion system protein VasG